VGACARLVEGPGHVVETTEVLAREAVEGGGREVEVELRAAGAAVSDRDRDLVATVMCRDLAAADGVVVGVATLVTGERVVQQMRHSGNEVRIMVGDAT
jgi:hypothetical protein